MREKIISIHELTKVLRFIESKLGFEPWKK